MHLSLFTKALLLTTYLHIFTLILHSLAGVQRGENNFFTFCSCFKLAILFGCLTTTFFLALYIYYVSTTHPLPYNHIFVLKLH